MIWYLIPLLFLLFCYKFKQDYVGYWMCFFVTALIYCSGYMTGSDWRAYEGWYNEATVEKLATFEKEQGFYWVQIFFKSIGFNFFAYTIFIKSLALLSVFYFVSKIISNVGYSLFFLFIIISLQGPFLFVNCPFRNLMAISLFLLIYQKFYQKKFVLYCILMILVTTIHYSAFFILLVTFLLKLFDSRITTQILLNLYLVSVLFSLLPFVFKDLFVFMQNFSTILDAKMEAYIYRENEASGSISFSSLGSLFNLLLFYLLYSKRKVFEKSAFFVIFKVALISLVIYRFGLVVPMLTRFYLYFFPFYAIAIGLVLLRTNWKNLRVFFITYCFITLYTVITKNYAYLPYTNYWSYYLQDDLKSFNYRNSFNLKAWFKKYNKMPGQK